MKKTSNSSTQARFMRFLVVILALCGADAPAWGNGNVSADEPAPPPIKTSVRKAPVRKPVRPVKKVKKVKKKAPTPKKAAAPRLSSLQRGVALMQQERYEAARPWLQKAIQEERRNPNAWYWYGMYHDRTGQFEQAQFFFTKALACDPTFFPLSRVVPYPSDGERVPLWDPLRPARIYPIPTNDHGIAIIPPDAPQAKRRPAPPLPDPDRPRVPVYLPPEPGATPDMGDAWQPNVYVPPGPEDAMGGAPVYVPPESLTTPTHPALLPEGAPSYGEPAPVYVPPNP